MSIAPPAPPRRRPLPGPRRGRRGVIAVVLFPLLLGLAGCGYGSRAVQDDAAAPAASGPKLSADQVRIGYFANVTHPTALVGLRNGGIIPRELGGTRVVPSVFNAGPSEIEALNAGSIDIGWIGPSPAINGYARAHGENLRIISGSASGGVRLVVNPDRITTLDDVRGKRIATPQLGNTQDVAFLHWIAERGWRVDPPSGKGDVSVVRTNNKVTPDAFRSGSVDGAWVPEPTASQLVAEGGKALLDERDLWPDRTFVITNMIVSQRFLRAHPDVVEAVLRGSVKTNAWLAAHPERAKQQANAALRRLTGAALPDRVMDAAWRSVDVLDDPLAGTLDEQARHAVSAGLLEEPDLSAIYDLTPLNKVLREEGESPVSAAGLGTQ